MAAKRWPFREPGPQLWSGRVLVLCLVLFNAPLEFPPESCTPIRNRSPNAAWEFSRRFADYFDENSPPFDKGDFRGGLNAGTNQTGRCTPLLRRRRFSRELWFKPAAHADQIPSREGRNPRLRHSWRRTDPGAPRPLSTIVAMASDRRPEVGSHVLCFSAASAIYLAGKISRSSSGPWAKTSGFSSSSSLRGTGPQRAATVRMPAARPASMS